MPHIIQIADNCKGKVIEDKSLIDSLKIIAEPTIENLKLEDNPNLLIFPRDLNEYGDEIGQQHVFEIEGNALKTGNIMGFIGYKDTRVRIHSRFDTNEKDFFLHYLLQKIFSINLFDLKYNTDTNEVFDFLLYLFPTFLKNALSQGLYKEYQTRYYNDANVRGRIDVNRHIRINMPFTGKVAYTTREYAFDNQVTQLIRHTIEYIAGHHLQGNILKNGEDIKETVRQIIFATPTYNRNERKRVIELNLRPVRHPYFTAYLNLQKLCLQILRHEEIKYGMNDDKIYGILFDGAWLWEEYLNTFLSDSFVHSRNKTGKGRKYVFTDHTNPCFPDFYNDTMVLDAKYKRYEDWKKIQPADIYQVMAYMHILDVSKAGLVVPAEHHNNAKRKQLNGRGGDISIFCMNVISSNNFSFREYANMMAEEESKLLQLICDDA